MPASAPKAAVHFQSLGCPKNLLDTEVMLGSLAVRGYAIAERLEDADVAVVNTCSFIESAREESIEAILEVADTGPGIPAEHRERVFAPFVRLSDRLSEGAGDPWGLAISADGKTLYAALSGVHQLAHVRLGGLHALLAGEGLPKADRAASKDSRLYFGQIWTKIREDPVNRRQLVNDLGALHGAGPQFKLFFIPKPSEQIQRLALTA